MARLAGLNSNLSSRARNTAQRIQLERQQLTDLSRATTSGAITSQTLNTNVGGPVNVLSVNGSPVTNVGNQGTVPYSDLARLLSQAGNNNYGALSYSSDWTPNMIQDYWARATLTRR